MRALVLAGSSFLRRHLCRRLGAGGASVVVTAATGIYQSPAQLLDLFEDVNLVHQDITRFVTQRAHLNLSDNTAQGHDPVEVGDGGWVLVCRAESGRCTHVKMLPANVETSGKRDRSLGPVCPGQSSRGTLLWAQIVRLLGG